MFLGVAGDTDLEISDSLQASDQRGSVGIASGVGTVLAAHAGRRISSQCHDVADPGVPVGARHVVDLALGRGYAGEVSSGVYAGLGLEPCHGLVRALARRAARAIGHGKERRSKRRQTGHRFP